MRFGERIAVVVFDGFAPFEMAVPCEVWGIDRVDMGVPRSEVRVCSTDASPLSTGLGFSVVVDHGMEALRWAEAIVAKSPTAQRMLKLAFNAVDDGLVGQQVFAGEATRLAYGTDEAVEGRDSFLEKRDPDWSAYPWYY